MAISIGRGHGGVKLLEPALALLSPCVMSQFRQLAPARYNPPAKYRRAYRLPASGRTHCPLTGKAHAWMPVCTKVNTLPHLRGRVSLALRGNSRPAVKARERPRGYPGIIPGRVAVRFPVAQRTEVSADPVEFRSRRYSPDGRRWGRFRVLARAARRQVVPHTQAPEVITTSGAFVWGTGVARARTRSTPSGPPRRFGADRLCS